jgi:hypothetical protein
MLATIRARQRREKQEEKRRGAQITGGLLGLGAVAASTWGLQQMPQAAEVLGIPTQAIAGGVLMAMGVAGNGADADMIFATGTALAAVGVHELTKARLSGAGG